jgi:hypothetical protein
MPRDCRHRLLETFLIEFPGITTFSVWAKNGKRVSGRVREL